MPSRFAALEELNLIQATCSFWCHGLVDQHGEFCPSHGLETKDGASLAIADDVHGKRAVIFHLRSGYAFPAFGIQAGV